MSVNNYTEPRIVTTNDLKTRSYVLFYFNNERKREYNGKNLNQKIQPNAAATIEERDKLLRKLLFELKVALENDAYPAIVKGPEPSQLLEQKYILTTSEVLLEALNKKLASQLCKHYKRNLKSIYEHFTAFLSPSELSNEITKIKRHRIEEFLSKFNSSGTYYMNKRRDLGVLFAVAGRSLETQLNIVKETETMRSKAKLHRIYEDHQIKPVLEYLQNHHNNLYLCCLITYGCFLRPHEEVRNLYGYQFKKDYSEIHLSGDENKGKKVRVVNIPEYVRKELLAKELKPDRNIFTGTSNTYNDAYFNTAWTRAWSKMNALGLIEKGQTMYSFRHTAAVQVYRRTKDVHLIQQLLGHSDIIVTIKYLRGLGEIGHEKLKEFMPQLNF